MTGESRDEILERIQKYTDENLPQFRKDQSASEKAKAEFGDAIPDVRPDIPEIREIDELLDRISIDDAYRRWCDKSSTFDIRVGNRHEGIMIRCPIPGHEDKIPSASMNTDKGVWHCHACEQGGDAYDLAAWHFGYDVPGYKQGDSFRRLREDMAEDLGLVIDRSGDVAKLEPDPAEPTESDNQISEIAPVLQLVPNNDTIADVADAPDIPWQELVARGTFLWKYMSETSKDNYPSNFHLFNGLMLISMANGRNCQIGVGNGAIRGNLYLCLYGGTATGKSQSWSVAKGILRDAVPYDHSAASTGARLIGNPASPEAVHDAFHKILEDPTVGEELHPVNGLIEVDEFSNLLNRRMGNDLKPILTEFYSINGPVSRVKAGGNDVIIEEPFCSMHTGTQPRAIRQYLSQKDADSGFLNRYIFAVANPKVQQSILVGSPCDTTTLTDMLHRMWVWCGRSSGIMRWTEDAGEAYESFYRQNIVPSLTEESDQLRAYTARMEVHLMKLILLMSVNEETTEIEAELVERVCRILHPTLAASYWNVKGDIQHDEVEEQIEIIVEGVEKYIKRHGYGPTRRDLRRMGGLRSDRGEKVPVETFQRYLDMAVNIEYLDLVKFKADNGKTIERYMPSTTRVAPGE